jgi:hypothetical protein
MILVSGADAESSSSYRSQPSTFHNALLPDGGITPTERKSVLYLENQTMDTKYKRVILHAMYRNNPTENFGLE